MAQGARITSIQTVADFREALCAFGASGRDALVAAESQVRRAVDWLADQTKFWQVQIRKCQEDLLRAKMELEQRKMENRDGRGRGTSEPEKNLHRAQERLRHAEERLANCRRWGPLLQHAIQEYEGPARQLAGALEADLRQAVALLDQKLAALEAYLALQAPAAPVLAPQSGPAENVVSEPSAAQPAAQPAGEDSEERFPS